MFLRWDVIRVVVKNRRDAIRVFVIYRRDTICVHRNVAIAVQYRWDEKR